MEERENKRPAGSRPSGSRPSGKRPTRERPNGSRPSGKRPSGSRPSNYSKAKKRRPQSKRRRKVYLMVRTTLMIILLLLIVAGVFVWKRYSPSKEQADLNKYYGIKQERPASYYSEQRGCGAERKNYRWQGVCPV